MGLKPVGRRRSMRASAPVSWRRFMVVVFSRMTFGVWLVLGSQGVAHYKTHDAKQAKIVWFLLAHHTHCMAGLGQLRLAPN